MDPDLYGQKAEIRSKLKIKNPAIKAKGFNDSRKGKITFLLQSVYCFKYQGCRRQEHVKSG